jgi:hypothetical protein
MPLARFQFGSARPGCGGPLVLDVGIDHVDPGAGRVAPGEGERLIVVLDVHRHAETELFDVGETGDRAGLLSGLGEDGEEDAARMAMIAMTTSSSISVKPDGFLGERETDCILLDDPFQVVRL